MNESRYLLAPFKDFKGSFLALGEWPSITGDLLEAGWSGLIVDHRSEGFSTEMHQHDNVKYLHGPIQPDPHYLQVGQNVWMRAITFREVLDNFAGPFQILLVNTPSFGKDILCSDATWNLWPKVIAVRAEGREQEIINLTSAHSYSVLRIERDCLILSRGGK
jgi:hypothetical protein